MGGEEEYKKGDRESKRHHMNTNVGYLPSSTLLQRIDLSGVIYNILYCHSSLYHYLIHLCMPSTVLASH